MRLLGLSAGTPDGSAEILPIQTPCDSAQVAVVVQIEFAGSSVECAAVTPRVLP